MKKRILLPFVISVFLSRAYAVDLQNPVVFFEATGKPSFLKIKGEGKDLKHEQKIEGNVVRDTFFLDLKTLDSGIGLRDEHLKEKYLKTKEYPTAKLELEAQDKSALDFQGEKQFSGKLFLSGKSKDLIIKARRTNNSIEANFDLNLSDFAIDIPSWNGISVADSVKIKTTFELPLEAPTLAR